MVPRHHKYLLTGQSRDIFDDDDDDSMMEDEKKKDKTDALFKKSMHRDIASDLYNQTQTGNFTDVIILVQNASTKEESVLYAHSSVLAAESPTLAKELSSFSNIRDNLQQHIMSRPIFYLNWTGVPIEIVYVIHKSFYHPQIALRSLHLRSWYLELYYYFTQLKMPVLALAIRDKMLQFISSPDFPSDLFARYKETAERCQWKDVLQRLANKIKQKRVIKNGSVTIQF